MNIHGTPYRTVWIDDSDPAAVRIIDQRTLPHGFEILRLRSVAEVCAAIRDMAVRGAGCIGATAGYGMYLAAIEANPAAFDADVARSASLLCATRPTAVNLAWAVQQQLQAMQSGATPATKIEIARKTAQEIADEDVAFCQSIGRHGLSLIREIAARKRGDPVNILTHCNAGWLAFVDHGSATAPMYAAHDAGIPVHVWVDETRPRNQGASLTAWELAGHGVPCHLIVDNAGGHLMQHGMVDLVIVGTDRTTVTGDVANKIGTYLKALAAADNQVPFYVAVPSSSIDWQMTDGLAEIPIEERDPQEVLCMRGKLGDAVVEVRIAPDGVKASNYGFDVTPHRLVTGLITERGICRADREEILKLFPEKSALSVSNL
ncbi:MAG: S-methyl-5-thioribose-1-phosphate isomerase [bacterium]